MFDSFCIPNHPLKTCKTCGEDKPESEFGDPHKNRPCLRNECKGCQGNKKRAYYYSKGKMIAYKKNYKAGSAQ